jgi:hypothetical protein
VVQGSKRWLLAFLQVDGTVVRLVRGKLIDFNIINTVGTQGMYFSGKLGTSEGAEPIFLSLLSRSDKAKEGEVVDIQ